MASIPRLSKAASKNTVTTVDSTKNAEEQIIPFVLACDINAFIQIHGVF